MPMHVRYTLVGVLFGVLLVPFVSAALTQEELQAQITELLGRVQALQAQLGQGSDSVVSTASTPSTTGSSAASPALRGGLTLSRYLERGMSGTDVSELQAFLARDTSIYPEGTVSGFYGPLTERAIERFQVACGIVNAGDYQSTGYGRVGPRTRVALRDGCSGGVVVPPLVGALLKVSPVSGAAPLTVSAEATINTPRSCDAAAYSLSFGDGTPPVALTVPSGTCAELVRTVPHIYSTPGTYTVSLNIGTHKTTVQVVVGAGTTVGTVTPIVSLTQVTNFATCMTAQGSTVMESFPRQCRTADNRTFVESITGTTGTTYSTANRLSLSPTTGTVPLSVAAGIQIRPGDPYEIDWGDGSAPTVSGGFADRQSLPVASTVFTQALQDVTLQHTYTTGGTKTVVLKLGQYEQEGSQYVWRTRFYTRLVNISGNSTQPDSLTATPTSGVIPFTATFSVRINGNGSCNGGEYTLDFGDGVRSSLLYPSGACAASTYSVTHQYVTNGTYTVKLYNVAQSAISASTTPVQTVTIVAGTGTTATTTVNASSSIPFTVIPGINSNPRQVEVRFTMPNACASYTLSWGDATANVTRAANTSGCSTASTDSRTHTHTYTANGTYTITLTVTGGAQSASLLISS